MKEMDEKTLEAWRAEAQQEMDRWRADPNYLPIFSVKIDWDLRGLDANG